MPTVKTVTIVNLVRAALGVGLLLLLLATTDNKQRARGEQDAYFSPVIKRTRIGNKRVRGEENKSLSAVIKRTRIAQTNGKKRFQQEHASFASK
jgi:hypothetical protein